jgi:L-ascorbate metabolism protein UlaG (beta-lactamase superfamily)
VSSRRPDYAARIGSVTYIGHATLLFELEGTKVLTDPALRDRILHIRRHVPPPRLDDLRGLDAILISHAHHDHLDVGSLRRLKGDCPVIAPRGCRWTLWRAGFRHVISVDPGDQVATEKLALEVLPAAHDGRRYPFGRRLPALGYLIAGPPSIYFAGDTDLFEAMGELVGRVDVAALPVSGWGSRVPAGHLDPERAARAVAMIRPRIAIPIHWGTLGTGPRLASGATEPRAFERAVSRIASDVDVRVLAPGESIEL